MAIIKNLPGTKELKELLLYLVTEGKTEEYLRKGINCSVDNVFTEFYIIKNIYNKKVGKEYYHITQSFSPTDNINPEEANRLGVEWINSCIKDHQIYMVTHIDKEHIHNHFIINSVNINNGKKLQISPKKLYEMKVLSNRICLREGLMCINLDRTIGKSVSDNEKRIINNNEYILWKEELRRIIDEVINETDNFICFVQKLKKYNIDVLIKEKSILYRISEKMVVRGKKLGGKYTTEGIERQFNEKNSK